VLREPNYGVVMITGYEEAVEVFHDSARFSSCLSVTGPFPGFPVPLEGDDVTGLIEEHRGELPFNDQLPTLDPPVHTAHRGLLMVHSRSTVDALLRLLPDVTELPGCPESPRPEFASHLEAFVAAVAGFVGP